MQVKASPRAEEAAVVLPDWIHRPAPVEARPPRPLAPSAIGEEEVPNPPPSPAMRAAAERGRLLHMLFERLPNVPEPRRAELAALWLERSAGVEDGEVRESLVRDACRIVGDPAYAALFSPAALAEAPIAAVVGEGIVVSGTVDRLLVEPDRVVVVDFKTGRRPPGSLADIPVPHLRQMAHYAEALKAIFPDRPVEAKLLYTAGPTLFDLPEATLETHRPGRLPAGG
jgi:ATP-dependent helicase/nuclease subunit A